MSREIKFRVYQPVGKKFYYWGFFKEHNQLTFKGIPTGAGLSIQDCKERSQQFTGLLDKNKVEIYEGDILDDYGEIEFDEWYGGWTIKFYYRQGSKYGKICNTSMRLMGRANSLTSLNMVASKDCIIIGNIYKNPRKRTINHNTPKL